MTKSKRNRKKKSEALLDDSTSRLEKLEALIEEAEAAVDSFNYDEAESKLNEVLQIDPNNLKCLEKLSGIYIEKSEWKKAEDFLQHCIEISPEVGYSKYFSIGQLCEGLESVRYYEKGIQVLEKELENDENIEPSKGQSKNSVVRDLSDAYCCIAEIFMSDCCGEKNAEEKCNIAIDLALQSDPLNPEAYQCLADFQLNKDLKEEAKETMQKSLSLWLPHFELETEGELEQNLEKESENRIPLYDSRIKASKLLIELQMYYEASKVLEGLLEEDDEVVEVWYLLGLLNYQRGEDEYKKTAHFYLKKTKEVGIQMGVDDECIEHTNELLEELASTHPISDDDEENDEDCEESSESDFSTDSEIDDKMEIL